MNEQNRDLLSEVIEDRLERALSGEDDDNKAFKEAMEAISKQNELYSIDVSNQKNAHDEQIRREEAKKDRIVQVATFAAGLVVAPIVEFICKKSYAKMLCEFEKDYTFTTTAGRGLSSLFRFKK